MTKTQGYLILSALWVIIANTSNSAIASILADTFAIYIAYLAVKQARNNK